MEKQTLKNYALGLGTAALLTLTPTNATAGDVFSCNNPIFGLTPYCSKPEGSKPIKKKVNQDDFNQGVVINRTLIRQYHQKRVCRDTNQNDSLEIRLIGNEHNYRNDSFSKGRDCKTSGSQIVRIENYVDGIVSKNQGFMSEERRTLIKYFVNGVNFQRSRFKEQLKRGKNTTQSLQVIVYDSKLQSNELEQLGRSRTKIGDFDRYVSFLTKRSKNNDHGANSQDTPKENNSTRVNLQRSSSQTGENILPLQVDLNFDGSPENIYCNKNDECLIAENKNGGRRLKTTANEIVSAQRNSLSNNLKGLEGTKIGSFLGNNFSGYTNGNRGFDTTRANNVIEVLGINERKINATDLTHMAKLMANSYDSCTIQTKFKGQFTKTKAKEVIKNVYNHCTYQRKK